jgi:putative aldouronate transport system permease protein
MRRKRRVSYSFLPLYIMLIPGAVYLIINNYLPMAGC